MTTHAFLLARALLATLLAGALLACSEPAFLLQAREERLIDTIRQTLLASVEAEKSAVLATTDEDSEQLAREARDFAREVDRLLSELRDVLDQDGRPALGERLDSFDACWAELVDVDERLLALAVANTNLKAARLAAREGLAAVDRFLGALTALQRQSEDPDVIRALGAASVAALREQALLLIHIPVAEDAEMTRLEEQMTVLRASVDRTLAALPGTPRLDPEALAEASAAWTEHRRIAAEVVRLSRENSNVRSFDVSVHEKRVVTKQCLGKLAALQEAVVSGPQPAR
jgi:hypothetical protein